MLHKDAEDLALIMQGVQSDAALGSLQFFSIAGNDLQRVRTIDAGQDIKPILPESRLSDVLAAHA